MGQLPLDATPTHVAVTIPIRASGKVNAFRADVKALNLVGDLAPAKALCRSAANNYRAALLATKFAQSKAKSPHAAVYVIGTEGIGINKVGYATDPQNRLCHLQIGNWNKLSIKGLVWFDQRAGAIESLVHEAAAEMGIGLRGEWIECSDDEACELILKAARYKRIPAYDSGIWLENWGARTQALAKSMGITDRIAA